MKGGKQLIKQEISCVLISLLFALSSSAQALSNERTTWGSFVLESRDIVPQSDSLTKLTAEDVQMIIEDETRGNPRALASLAGDPEQRKKVLDNLKQALAIASEARKNGFAEQSDIKMQLDLAELEVLATAYDDKLKAEAGKPSDPTPPFGYIEEKAVNAFFEAPTNKIKYDKELEKFLGFIRDTQKKADPPTEISNEQKQFIISQWKKVVYGAAKAKESSLTTRNIELQYKLQQALILARAYSQQKLTDQVTPTDIEVKAYIAQNPRFDKSGKRVKAEEILAKAKSGQNFAALADLYSEDPGNVNPETGKAQGGFYDWNIRDGYVREFSDAAWSLEAGQVSELVETQFGYHIIKLEGKRIGKDPDGNDREEVKVRHILISTMYKDKANPMAPGVPMEEAAKKELSEQKQLKVLDEISLRNPIDLPADFTLTVAKSPAPKAAAPKSTRAAVKSRKPAAKTRTLRKKH